MTYIQYTLTRYLSGEATPDEAEAVELWINESTLNQREFQRQWKIFELTSLHSDYRLPDIEIEWKKTECQVQELSRIRINANPWHKLLSYKVILYGAMILVATATFVLKTFFREQPGFTKLADRKSNYFSGKKVGTAIEEPVKLSERKNRIKNKPYTQTSLNRHNIHVLDFNDLPLKEAVNSLEKEYGILIKLQNPDIGSCRITSRFEHKTLTEILDIMGFTLGFNYKYLSETGNILITGNECK